MVFGAMLLLPPTNPDQHLVSVSMEIPIKGAASAYASASFAPNQANGCGGMYETVVYWPQKCDVVANKISAHSKRSARYTRSFTCGTAAYQQKSSCCRQDGMRNLSKRR